MDHLGKKIHKRVTELMNTRPDLTRADLELRIHRGASWLSEFLRGKRTTNDLRLLISLCGVFGVTVDYMLGESDRRLDVGAMTLLATWRELQAPDRELLLKLAASVRQRDPIEPGAGTPSGAQP